MGEADWTSPLTGQSRTDGARCGGADLTPRPPLQHLERGVDLTPGPFPAWEGESTRQPGAMPDPGLRRAPQ